MFYKLIRPITISATLILSAQSAFALEGKVYCYINDVNLYEEKKDLDVNYVSFVEKVGNKKVNKNGYLFNDVKEIDHLLLECLQKGEKEDLNIKKAEIRFDSNDYLSYMRSFLGKQYGYPFVIKDKESGKYDNYTRAGFYYKEGDIKYENSSMINLCINNSTEFDLPTMQVYNYNFSIYDKLDSIKSGQGKCTELLVDDTTNLLISNVIKKNIKDSSLINFKDIKDKKFDVEANIGNQAKDAQVTISSTSDLINITFIDENVKQIVTDWLSKIDDETLVSDLILPGSHDAGMNQDDSKVDGIPLINLLLPKNYVYNQNLNVEGQLKSGSRVMDIRLEKKDNNLVTFHKAAGIGGIGENIDSILDGCLKFINRYNTEFIILRVSNTKKEAIGELLEKLRTSNIYDKLFVPTAKIWGGLKVGGARGKIMVIIEPSNDNLKLIKQKGMEKKIVLGQKIKNINSIEGNGIQENKGDTFGGFAGTQNIDKMINVQYENGIKLKKVFGDSNPNSYQVLEDSQINQDYFNGSIFKSFIESSTSNIKKSDTLNLFDNIELTESISLDSQNRRDFGFQVSWTFTGGFGDDVLLSFDIPYFSNSVNARLGSMYQNFMQEIESKPQIVNLDFVSPELTYVIIKNQIKSKKYYLLDSTELFTHFV
ncbi:hypothetical protein LA02_1531 [Francisella philomiragia]|uniref:hypothetical protein n=1 Tax=Francisella philomiragia TaxID=28110 RepID=UPI0005A58100|nr:hypothetical protein [Francisella philomiragia]AJI56394.1 hypothetical protein LA02_1531 [Francisella philomiragia]